LCGQSIATSARHCVCARESGTPKPAGGRCVRRGRAEVGESPLESGNAPAPRPRGHPKAALLSIASAHSGDHAEIIVNRPEDLDRTMPPRRRDARGAEQPRPC